MIKNVSAAIVRITKNSAVKEKLRRRENKFLATANKVFALKSTANVSRVANNVDHHANVEAVEIDGANKNDDEHNSCSL